VDLRTVRKNFIAASGRLDLVKKDGSNNGADWFINAGQRLLDRMIELPQMQNSFVRVMPPGGYTVLVEDCRVVQEVWVDIDGVMKRLTLLSHSDAMQKFPKIISARNTSLMPNIQLDAGTTYAGTPLYYCRYAASPSPRQQNLLFAGNTTNTAGMLGSQFGDLFNQTALMILPPVETQLAVKVVGIFYSVLLSDDGQITFWTMQAPDILVHAAMYQLEVFYRNMEGARGWMLAIQQALTGLDHDVVSEEQSQVNEIEG
jgi:hypothetical protein